MAAFHQRQHFFFPILKFLTGALIVTFITVFLILTLPAILFRFVASYLAKIHRPDLGDILKNISGYLAADFLSEKPPRANNVLTLVFKGKFDYEGLKADFYKNWITHAKTSSYEHFAQYPVHYMGFTFWKKARDTFKIENNIKLLSPENKIFTEEDLDNAVNKLLNNRLPPNQSPWQLFLVENYQPGNSSSKEPHCLVIFKWHHCLADGYAVMLALLEGFFEDFSVDQLELPNIQFPKRSAWQKFWFVITFPINLFVEASFLFANNVIPSQFKIPDTRKQWHQVCVRTKPILVEDVKNIKNCVGVSYTSVLLSAISAAVDTTLNKSQENKLLRDMLCGSVIPVPGPTRNPGLTNYVTAAIFKLPLGPFRNPTERLQATNKMLESSRNSAIPYVFYYFACITGNHSHYATSLFYNRIGGLGLTNFAGVPTKIGKDDRICTECHTVAGALGGELGVAITAVSHDKQVFIQMCVENALMSKEEAQRFLDLIPEEIQRLYEIVSNKKL